MVNLKEKEGEKKPNKKKLDNNICQLHAYSTAGKYKQSLFEYIPNDRPCDRLKGVN